MASLASSGGGYQLAQPVSGPGLFWAVFTLALTAMTLPSLVASQFTNTDRNFEGALTPQASSPFYCLADAIFEAVVLLRRVSGVARRSQGDQDPSVRDDSLPVPASAPRAIASSRASKWFSVITTLMVLPLAVKVFGMRGIPVTQFLVGCYLATSLTRLFCTFAGRNLEPDKRAVYLFWQRAAKDGFKLHRAILIVHFYCTVFLWSGISRSITLPVTDNVASVSNLSHWVFTLITPFFILHIVWCLIIFFNQWRFLRWWPVPISPLAVYLPLFSISLGMQYFIKNGQHEGDWQRSWTDFQAYVGIALISMSFMALFSFGIAVLVTPGSKRTHMDEKREATDHASETIAEITDAKPSEPMEATTHDRETAVTDDGIPSVVTIEGGACVGSPFEASTTTADPAPSPKVQNGQGGSMLVPTTRAASSQQLEPDVASGPRKNQPTLTALDACTFALMKSAPKFDKEEATLHPIDRLSVSAWKPVWGVFLVCVWPSPDPTSQGLTSGYRTGCSRAFLCWLSISAQSRDFRLLIPGAFRSIWKDVAQADRCKSTRRKVQESIVLAAWVMIWLVVHLVIFYGFFCHSTIDYGAILSRVEALQTHYKDNVRWTSFAIFNLTTAAMYYTLGFDGTGTADSGWWK